jgi:hypothetical protein
VKLVGIITVRLNETYSKVRLSDVVLVHSGLKQKDALLTFTFNFASEYAVRKLQKMRKDWYWMEYISS